MSSTKLTILASAVACMLILAAFMSQKTPPEINGADVATAVIEDGVQYVDVTAQGGYTPRRTKAQAGVPTVIRVKTENTYDCSSSLVIPQIGYSTFLERTGVEEITVPLENTQGTLRGLCSMAMYQFEITFE